MNIALECKFRLQDIEHITTIFYEEHLTEKKIIG